MVEFKVQGKELIRKTVRSQGTGGVVYCRKEWIGKEVVVILEGE